MFNLLRTVFTLLICVLVVGYFLGWFTFKRSPTDSQTINVSVHKEKMGGDLQRLEQKVDSSIKELKDTPPNTNPSAPQQNTSPRLSFGPITVQPTVRFDGQPSGTQPSMPGMSYGPPPASPPPMTPPTQDYQYTPAPPISMPPPGEGR
jgi:hypothetical protein